MDEHISDIFIDLSKNIGEMNANIGNLCAAIQSHENRLTNLERQSQNVGKDGSWKDGIIRDLVKAIIFGMATIATLSGSGALLTKIIGA